MSNNLQITRLVELEAIISKGRDTFVEVGAALLEIRHHRLYKPEFTSFESYCREKWGWSRMRASQMISASETVLSLPENVNNCLQNESQARELAKVEPEKRAEVLEMAQAAANEEGCPVTARHIEETARVAAAAQKFSEPGAERVAQILASPEVVNAGNESACLFHLKRWWKKATKKDRKLFLNWTHEYSN